jgi:transposase
MECIMTTGLAAGTYELFGGIDIAATTAEVSTQRPGAQARRSFKIDQTPEGFTRLVHKLQATGTAPSHVLVVMEAPGSYGISLATRLGHDGFRVSVINPSQAHHFATALLQRAKPDAMDAQTLAQLAVVLQPEPWRPPPQIYSELQPRVAQRDDLLHLRQQVRNQLHALAQHPEVMAAVRTRMESLLAIFPSQIDEVEVEIAAGLNQDAAWAVAAERRQSIQGVGGVTAAGTLVTTLNFTTCDTVDSLTAYAGLAPLPRQSGSSVWHRPAIGHSGNGRLRTAFYMATLTAARFNPAIKAFYSRLIDAGKPEKVARCAAARKLLHIAWAVVKKDQPFDPYYVQGVKKPT